MIPHLDSHAGAFQQGRHMAHPTALARVHKYQAVKRIPVKIAVVGKAVRLCIKAGKELLQAALLAAGKKQNIWIVKMTGRKHGGKGIKIRIGMTGDQGCFGGCHIWLRGWNWRWMPRRRSA